MDDPRKVRARGRDGAFPERMGIESTMHGGKQGLEVLVIQIQTGEFQGKLNVMEVDGEDVEIVSCVFP